MHVGINNLKSNTPASVANSYKATVKNVQKQFPKSKIYISEATPVKDQHLDLQRKLLNAQLAADFESSDSISVITHSTLRANNMFMKDAIHPNRRGSSVLAGNIGRVLHNNFWTRPKYHHRRSPHFHYNRTNVNYSPYQDNSVSPKCRRQDSIDDQGLWGSRYRFLYEY